ncbi:hypothetical protein ACFQX8_02965 [Klenkia terrae]|uniref:hypothetical protein n=1 Tax=Klenkia terrae TaxID=1052259 RepID=UPI0036097E8C
MVVGVVVLGWPARQLTTGWPVPGSVLVACDVGQGDALVLPTAPGRPCWWTPGRTRSWSTTA